MSSASVRVVHLFACLILFATTLAVRAAGSDIAIEIDLSAQKARLLYEGSVVYESPISSGRAGHRTRTGSFRVVEKSADHRSSLYGKIVDAGGRTLVASADRSMGVPGGAKFVPAPMRHFLRFDGATGTHAGHLPGHPASHGCVRMPADKAALFFNIVEIGTPVRVFGSAPGGIPAPRLAAKPQPTPAPSATPAPKRRWLPVFQLGAR